MAHYTLRAFQTNKYLKNLLFYSPKLGSIENALARENLLHDGALHSEHCQAAIVELLVLQCYQFLWILRLQVERVEAVVSHIFAIIISHCSSKLMASGHNPESRPEILSCSRCEMICNRVNPWAVIPSVEERVKFLLYD